MRRNSLVLAILAGSVAMVGALAQQDGSMQHGTGGHVGGTAAPMARGAPANPAVTAYRAANDRMHSAMDIAYTGDADKDFALSMIPHHQGAIDMARVVLAHGKDVEMRRLAQAIVVAQQAEIAQIEAWLARAP